MSLLGKLQILIWVFYVVMTTLNTPPGVQGRCPYGRPTGSEISCKDRLRLLDLDRDMDLCEKRLHRLERDAKAESPNSTFTAYWELRSQIRDVRESEYDPWAWRTEYWERHEIRILIVLLEISLNLCEERLQVFERGAEGEPPTTPITTSTTVAAVTMSSPGQAHVLNPGQSVQLRCEFLSNNFNLFDNPVTWIKKQEDKETQISIMGNLLEPYDTNERYDLTATLEQPRYGFTLSLENVSMEEIGSYTCKVRGHASSVLATVTHDVLVKEVDPPASSAHRLRNGLKEPEGSGSGEE